MTWKDLFARLKDPTIVFALLAAFGGEIQAQTNALLEFLGPTWAGRLVSAGALIAAMLRVLQTMPPKPSPDTHDDGTSSDSQ
jgi:hypothetical protein